jgi:pimeloyl-ACP methyl ester carboxylesterase
MVDIYWELQADVAARSSKGRLVKVDGATHEMPFERADAVAGAIREVLGGPPVTP